MNAKEQRLPDYLEHMAEAIDRTAEYTNGIDKGTFCATKLLIDGVIRNKLARFGGKSPRRSGGRIQ